MPKYFFNRGFSFSILTFLLVSFGCATLKGNKSTEPITVLSATSQKWHGGTAKSGSGTRYEIMVVARTNDIQIDSLYLTAYTVKLTTIKDNKEATAIQKGDTLLLKASTNKNTIKQVLTDDGAKPLGVAQLSVTSPKKRRQFVPIEKIEALKELYYP